MLEHSKAATEPAHGSERLATQFFRQPSPREPRSITHGDGTPDTVAGSVSPIMETRGPVCV
jgi:hypothetical protein